MHIRGIAHWLRKRWRSLILAKFCSKLKKTPRKSKNIDRDGSGSCYN